ncbi:ATP-dependent DNA helicase MER3 [Coniothyrium glycines]
MNGNHHTMHNRHERAGIPRQASQYDMLQPRLMTETNPVARRDQFRSTQHQDFVRDYIEDDDVYEANAVLDSFDEQILRQPYQDCRRQATQGTSRLSLAPPPTKFTVQTAPLQSHAQSAYSNQPPGYRLGDEHLVDLQLQARSLSRFAYNAGEVLAQDYSSDAQVGASSSPAFRAGRRKANHEIDLPIDAAPSVQGFQQEYSYDHSQYGTRPDRNQQTLYDVEVEDEFADSPPASTRLKKGVEQSYQPLMDSKSKSAEAAWASSIPMVQGIRLVPISILPDRFRSMFPFPTFNAVQSKCFSRIFQSDDNFVLSSPTGSGKTAILELAVCRAVATNATEQYKIVYQAPTKALCSERQRDWEKKFSVVGLKCAELTGDSNAADLRNVQTANIIITTPEKWDSVTRKWKDHEKLMKLIKLFLIDEVHILKEDRGAVLEVIVSRMKLIGNNVRFVALSATVPNLQDVAAWLGKNTSEPHVPALHEKFGEEFRPVKLRKHVCGYVCNSSNEFAFEKILDSKLPEVITKFSERKPMMIFCATRNSTVNTAKLIAAWWSAKQNHADLWSPPSRPPTILNKDLRDLMLAGVAFHHAGLELDDRTQVEKGFLTGEINVICCTSTLAVGVNLPCHLVIIKNTMTWTSEGSQEYSNLETMQMLGRAGRPQFDDSAIAVIMTRQTKVRKYEMMVTGQETLESTLHLNLVDHMNAEIGLGTIRDLPSASKWLKGTFLYVRIQQNPDYYKLEGSRNAQAVDEQLDDICYRDIALLRDTGLVSGDELLRCTEFGLAMSRYYVHFCTMKVFIGLQPRPTPSEILSALSQADEFSKLRFRQGEKALYKLLNKSPSIRWSIPVNLDLPAQKVSLIIQSVLGNADISWDGDMSKHKTQFSTEVAIVFKSISSLIRCIIDCQISLGDSIGIHSALMIERSLGARAWDDSPAQMKQIESIGIVAVRKLVNAGIRCMDDLEACDPHRIETLLGRNPPFGLQILEKVKQFPKLRVSLHVQPSSVMKTAEGAKIQVKAEIGFINEKPPMHFNKQLVYVCLLAETTDGRKIHFARISGPKLGNGQSLVFPALLTSADQSINCYVMCDSIAGSMRGATVKPQIGAAMFSGLKALVPDANHQPNMSRRRTEDSRTIRKPSTLSEDFDDDGIDDDALVKASIGDLDFDHIDNYADPTTAITRKNTGKNKSNANVADAIQQSDELPARLPNGKWVCNHPCKDRIACKHLCCKTGMDKPPKKKATAKRVPTDEPLPQAQAQKSSQKGKVTQTKLQLSSPKRKMSGSIEELDMTQRDKKQRVEYAKHGPKDYRNLHQLHNATQGRELPSSLLSAMHTKPAYCYSQGGDHDLSFLGHLSVDEPTKSSDYGDICFDNVSSHLPNVLCENEQQEDPTRMFEESLHRNTPSTPDRFKIASRASDSFGDADSLLGEVMIGLADSHQLQVPPEQIHDTSQGQQQGVSLPNFEVNSDYDSPSFDLESCSFERNHPKNEVVTPIDAVFQGPKNEAVQSCAAAMDNPTEITHKILDLRRMEQAKAAKDPDETCMKAAESSFAFLNKTESGQGDSVKQETMPEAFKDLEPWLFREFGSIVEIVDE